jgi:chromosome segregation protein
VPGHGGPVGLDAAGTLVDEDLAIEPAALEAQVAELREKLARMGEVNVLAVEQAQEHEERHAFLTAQRQDLVDSISELDSAIRKIDKASRERFQEAFQVINQHFGETFRQLFGGGTAGLVAARRGGPARERDRHHGAAARQAAAERDAALGRREGAHRHLAAVRDLPVQAVALLHPRRGGRAPRRRQHRPLREDARRPQRADAVRADHPLRKTMAIADQLYGVTMEEPGVSKLVSVRFT